MHGRFALRRYRKSGLLCSIGSETVFDLGITTNFYVFRSIKAESRPPPRGSLKAVFDFIRMTSTGLRRYYRHVTEQAAIVRFLDHADRRIRRYILAKQKLIKLLEEQKQAIIHRAVTRGLDSSVRLKPSDVEWLGDVPEHWEVTLRVKTSSGDE